MSRHGYALVVALAGVMLISGALVFLLRATAALISTRRELALREEALRRAEGSLERARSAVAAGRLTANGKADFDGTPVTCSAAPGGVRLEAMVELDSPGRGAARRPESRQGVRVAWDLTRSAEAGWTRTGWQARDETLLAARGPRR